MNKAILTVSASVLGLAGLAWAAAGGMGGGGANIVQLPAGSQAASSPARSIQATPAPDDGGFQLAADGKHIVDAYICVFRAGAVGRGSERSEAARATAAAGGRLGHVYDVALQGFSLHASAQGVAQMQTRNPRIDYCEQDAVATIIDPINALARPGGGGGGTPIEKTPDGITYVRGGASASAHTAFVIDTGIDLDHPDLLVAAQGNGLDGQSANFVARETSAEDLNGHGSHVAGTIAARKNGFGVVGVAPGTRLVAVRVLNRRGSGAYSDVIAGVNYVATYGQAGDVANMSLGGPVSQALDTAVMNASGQKKIWFALAAGNEGEDADLHSPGRVNGTYIRTVAAFNAANHLWASFSNFSPTIVDYAEPGVYIESTWKDGGYNTISGTSMATPHMAGILLLAGPATATDFVTRTGTSENYAIGKL